MIDSYNNTYILAPFFDTIYSPFNAISKGGRDLLLIKINPSGQTVWYNNIGSTDAEVAGGITLDNQNNIYITGTFRKTCYFSATDTLVSTGNGDIFLSKYTQDGAFQWARRIGSSSTLQSSSDIMFNGDNELIISGYYTDSLILGYDPQFTDTLTGNTYTVNFIAAIDMNGNPVWNKRFLGSNNLTRIYRIKNSQNGYYFGGYFQGNLSFDIGSITSYSINNYDVFIYKTDFEGNGQWVRRIRGQNNENFRTLTTDEYDNVYVLGNYNSPAIFVDSTETITKTYTGNSGGYDTYIAKYNRSGVLQWFLRKGSTAKDIYNDFVVRNNLIYATGYFANQIIFNNDTLHTDNDLNEDAFLAAFNEIGDPIAGVSIQGTGNYNDAGTIVNMDEDSRAYVSGYYRSQEIKIGEQTYTSSNINKSDLFFAIYQHPFKAVITDEQMVSCNGLSDGMLEVTPYFGRPPYSYSWSHNPSLNEPVAENLPPADYTVTVTDANSNQTSISKTITQPQPLEVDGLVTPVSCYNGDDGEIDITVTGGTKSVDYLYNWTTFDGSGLIPLNQDQTGLTDGTYTVFVKDVNNCTKTKDFVVNHPALLNFTGTIVTPITIPPGNNGAIDLFVSGGNAPYSFEWTGPESFSASSEDLVNLETAGLYNLSLSDSKACDVDTSLAVLDGITMVAQITAKTDVTCFGQNDGTATVTVYNGVPPYLYKWSDQSESSGLAIRTGMAPGTYYVEVTDSDMPVHTAQASIEISGPPSALNLVLNTQDVLCYQENTGIVDLFVSGGVYPYTYSWSNGYTGEDLVNVPASTYVVNLTDANNCIANASADVLEPSLPLGLDVEVTDEILCHGDNDARVIANASGGVPSYSYLWDDPGTQTTESAFDLSAGTYHVVVTDENGCIKTASITVFEPDTLSIETVLNNPSCPGLSDGSIIPTPIGGTGPDYEYIWSNDVFERFNTDIPAGTYTLTLNDENGCTIVDEFTLVDPDTVKITSVDITNLTCSGHDDGSITINASGGTIPYEYSTDGGLTFVSTSNIGSLAKGNYDILVIDNNNCTSENYPITLSKSETCGLVIYDAFSPNDDGKNEVWNIGNMDNFPSCKVKIFNIWGIAVFSSNGYGIPWDGTYNGNDLPSGTYYYVIDLGDGSDILTGAVSIVK